MMMRHAFRAAALSAAFGLAFTAGAHAASIAETAAATDDLSTLVTAVEAADLGGTLSGEGPFTVFAPTNAAFSALPEGTLDGLLADKGQLTGVLTYHVVPAEVNSTSLVEMIEADGGSHTVTTVSGGTLTASMADGNVILTDAKGNTARVVQADVDASNGVVHVIDAVLLP
jgi:uncharacterized surface protein with fasciclin (FAS1) repeats